FRLGRLVITETALLATLGTAGALFAAFWGELLLRRQLLPDVNWAATAGPLHWRILAFSMALGLGTGLGAGLMPAIQAATTDLASALNGGRSVSHTPRSLRQATFVGAQTAFSVVLLAGAGLFIRSLSTVRSLAVGFDVSQVLYASVDFDTRDSTRDAHLP